MFGMQIPSRRRSMIGITFAFTAIAVPAAASPPTDPPEHRGTGTITGLVTDPAGDPAADVCVDAWGDQWGGSATTDEAGRFSVTDLSAGSYIVAFFDCAAERRFPNEYHLDAASVDDATPVQVADGTVTKVLAQMDAGATISGTLTDDAGDPAPYVCVGAEPAASEAPGSWTVSDGNGAYTLRGMRSGDHVVSFSSCEGPIAVPVVPDPKPMPSADPRIGASSISPDPAAWTYGYLREYWQDADTSEAATPVSAIEGADVGGIDAVLQRASGIDVHATDVNGEPATSICADAYAPDGTWLSSSYGDGWLTIGGLQPGDALVHVQDCGFGRYRSQWFDGADRIEDATTIGVPALGAASITVTLADAPMPDLAVTRLRVTPVKLRTDAADLPGPGTQRDVRAVITNDGDADADTVGIVIDATTRSDRARELLHLDVISLAAGASTTIDLRADLTGKVGDLDIRVSTCTWTERDLTNNEATEHTYAVVGGTGIGVSPTGYLPGPASDPPATECSSLLWWDGPSWPPSKTDGRDR